MKSIENTLEQLNSGAAALASLCDGFYSPEQTRIDTESVSADQISDPHRKLLVHTVHMTDRLYEFHGAKVELDVQEERRTADVYARKILLRLRGRGNVVEFGIVRIQLDLISSAVEEEILAHAAPLGDILNRHQVMRIIDPKWYFRFGSGSPFVEHLDETSGVFGRVGIIHCNAKPAIQLLEVVSGG